MNTIQGVRSYDPAMGTWTTPDAYAGDASDPMSRKSYMWDRNNAFAYSDPTGFEPTVAESTANDGTKDLTIDYQVYLIDENGAKSTAGMDKLAKALTSQNGKHGGYNLTVNVTFVDSAAKANTIARQSPLRDMPVDANGTETMGLTYLTGVGPKNENIDIPNGNSSGESTAKLHEFLHWAGSTHCDPCADPNDVMNSVNVPGGVVTTRDLDELWKLHS